ncbi:hemerythrin domain-containing protein [Polaromonas hydrogenivorans]|uniref:Hemerythrin domain-containing protein n=1 Tax=Polaromonas hydrogenivorans TaxID=335476 RepID=A0AAU7LY12_9BURK
MTQTLAYEDAVDLLDADHKAVKKLFIDFNALCEDNAPAEHKQHIARRICQELTVHAQIEEEIFYPQVREAIGDNALMDEALAEHTQAKETIARIQAMDASDEDYDDTVKALGKLIDHHVLEEREQIFLKARNAALDLRGMAPALFARKKQLLSAAKPPASRGKKRAAA